MSVIKLTDFGIAKLAEGEIATEMERFTRDNATLTSSNTLLGAVPYMAPECWANWTDAGQPMDIWALGCIGYQLITGQPPFGTGQLAIRNVVMAEVHGVQLQKPAWFNKHPSTRQLEQELWEIILSCIQVDPTARPSASDVVAACDNLCYAAAPRKIGTINRFGVGYASGGRSNAGNITDGATNQSLFFHGSDYFGSMPPASGQRVNFSVYPGVPSARCSPVLLLQ